MCRQNGASEGSERWQALGVGPQRKVRNANRLLELKMKLGLYSITYLGVWYRGRALTLDELIGRAREYGYEGVEIDGKRPHGSPLDLPRRRCEELRLKAADA